MTPDARPHESPLAVYGAIAANVAIAVTKFAVALHTGSSAMLSEAVHSTVDTGNGVLLLWGVWAMRTAYAGWCERRLTQRQFVAVVVRFAAMYVVLSYFLLS